MGLLFSGFTVLFISISVAAAPRAADSCDVVLGSINSINIEYKDVVVTSARTSYQDSYVSGVTAQEAFDRARTLETSEFLTAKGLSHLFTREVHPESRLIRVKGPADGNVVTIDLRFIDDPQHPGSAVIRDEVATSAAAIINVGHYALTRPVEAITDSLRQNPPRRLQQNSTTTRSSRAVPERKSMSEEREPRRFRGLPMEFLQGVLQMLNQTIVKTDNQQPRVRSFLEWLRTGNIDYVGLNEQTASKSISGAIVRIVELIDQFFISVGQPVIFRIPYDDVIFRTVPSFLGELADRIYQLNFYFRYGTSYDPSFTDVDPGLIAHMKGVLDSIVKNHLRSAGNFHHNLQWGNAFFSNSVGNRSRDYVSVDDATMARLKTLYGKVEQEINSKGIAAVTTHPAFVFLESGVRIPKTRVNGELLSLYSIEDALTILTKDTSGVSSGYNSFDLRKQMYGGPYSMTTPNRQLLAIDSTGKIYPALRRSDSGHLFGEGVSQSLIELGSTIFGRDQFSKMLTRSNAHGPYDVFNTIMTGIGFDVSRFEAFDK